MTCIFQIIKHAPTFNDNEYIYLLHTLTAKYLGPHICCIR